MPLETSSIGYVSSMGASRVSASLLANCTAPHSPYVFLQYKVRCQKRKLQGFTFFLNHLKEILFFAWKFYLERESKLVHIDKINVVHFLSVRKEKKNNEIEKTVSITWLLMDERSLGFFTKLDERCSVFRAQIEMGLLLSECNSGL